MLVEIDPLASTQLFATYLGGSADEFAAGIALDSNGNIYIAGSTDSTDLPTTQGSFQDVLGGGTDAFVMKIGPSSAPSVSLSPSSLQYAAQSVGATSPAQTVLLRNMGSSPLAISSITPNGDFAESDTCGTSVPAAGNCSFSVTFTPTAAGSRSGSIVIQDNAAGAPHIINLSGVGNGPLALFTPQNLTFPTQSLGTTSAAQAISLSNGGNQTLGITSIQVTGDFAQVNNCPSTLTASSSCTINVTFTPTAFGTRTGTLAVSDNAQGSPQTANLTGSGPAPPAPVVAFAPANLAFSAQPVKTSSPAQAVTLSNTGNATLNLSAIQITGDFAQANNCPSTLAANSSCTINVTFTPTASGARTGSLTVSDNAQGSPQVVNITGAGADFNLAGSPNSDTVQPGSAASYKLTVSSIGAIICKRSEVDLQRAASASILHPVAIRRDAGRQQRDLNAFDFDDCNRCRGGSGWFKKISDLCSLDSIASDRFIWNPADRIKKPDQENPLTRACGSLDAGFDPDDGLRRRYGYRADFSDPYSSNWYRGWNLYRHGYRHFRQSAALAPGNACCPVKQPASCGQIWCGGSSFDEILKDMPASCTQSCSESPLPS